LPHAVTLKWRWIAVDERRTRGLIDAAAMLSRAGGVNVPIWIGLSPGGHPLCGTTAVAADVAVVDPLLLCAVTLTRSVCPTSLTVGV
jgi:hypothetical protein